MAPYDEDRWGHWNWDSRPRHGWDDYVRRPAPPRGENRPEYLGWSRPDFNVSQGGFGSYARPDAGGGDWYERQQGIRGRQQWRTGEPWGRGGSAATRVTVRQIMTENPESVTRDTPLADVARRMRDLDVGIIPVVRDADTGTLEGVITDRDIAVRAAADGEDMKKAVAGDFMSTDVATVRLGDSVRDVFSVMKRKRVRRVPVTDDAGRLVGIIAQADLAVDYAGLDLDRETEVEEVLERISEPARPQRAGGHHQAGMYAAYGRHPAYERDFADRLRHGWNTLKREARDFVGRGYDRHFF